MNSPLPQHFFVREIENYCKQNLFNMPFGTKRTGIYQISKLKTGSYRTGLQIYTFFSNTLWHLLHVTLMRPLPLGALRTCPHPGHLKYRKFLRSRFIYERKGDSTQVMYQVFSEYLRLRFLENALKYAYIISTRPMVLSIFPGMMISVKIRTRESIRSPRHNASNPLRPIINCANLYLKLPIAMCPQKNPNK